MTAIQRVRRVQRVLVVAAIASALLWGAAATLAILAIGSVAERHDLVVDAARVQSAALMAFGLVAIFVLWRARRVWSPRRVALWIEERVPQLQYALVTASDPAFVLERRAGSAALLDATIARAPITREVSGPALRAPLVALVALLVAAGALELASASSRARLAVVQHVALERIGVHTPIPNRLATLRVRITDPPYAGGRVHDLDDPSAITALVGSTIAIEGTGGRASLGARLGDRAVHVGGTGDEWSVLLGMPARAAALTLTDRKYQRALAIIPVIDRPPTVTLALPARDTVWRVPPAGTLAVSAQARDDIGLASGRFEYTVTTGSGEVFKARTGTFGDASFGGASSGTLHASLPLAPLSLAAGDVLSVRAVVSDANAVTGPGVTTSDTRTLRVARPGEYDSVSVDGAPPPPVESSLLTERMLIDSADSLYKARARTPAAGYKESAGRLGMDQASLRKRVYDILYQQDEAGKGGVEGDDEELDPQLVINRDLKEAYDAMWDAERSLDIAEIPQALPAMTRALHALDRARLANRLYLRGRTPRIVVNVEKARLTGKDKGASNLSTVHAPVDSARRAAGHALDAAAPLARTDRAAFVAALTRLRVETATSDRAFSDAVGAAIDRARNGGDVGAALSRARRILDGAPDVTRVGASWLGGWPGAGKP